MLEPPTRRTIGPQLPASQLALSFGGQIRDYAKVVGRRIDYVHRSVALQLFTAVVMDTPVDLGLARGSWKPSKGFPVMGGGQKLDPAGTLVLKEIQAVVGSANVDDVLYLMNSVEYIIPLEYGWSGQSPEGMVRINVARIERIIKETVQSARSVK